MTTPTQRTPANEAPPELTPEERARRWAAIIDLLLKPQSIK